jgi:plasmid stabilization system protein ParE
MSYRVQLTPRAQQELDAIIDWIGKRSPQGAARLLAAFRRRLSDVRAQPSRFGTAAESRYIDDPIREVLFRTRRGQPYRALYVILEEVVHIIHIRAPGQDLMHPDAIELPR